MVFFPTLFLSPFQAGSSAWKNIAGAQRGDLTTLWWTLQSEVGTLMLAIHWFPSDSINSKTLEFLKQITNQLCAVKDELETEDFFSLPVCCGGVLDHLCLRQRDDIPQIAWQLYPRVAEPRNGEWIKINNYLRCNESLLTNYALIQTSPPQGHKYQWNLGWLR